MLVETQHTSHRVEVIERMHHLHTYLPSAPLVHHRDARLDPDPIYELQ